MSIFTNQRGAMFGLDARLALVILGGLSLVVGAAFTFNLKRAEGHGLYRNIEAITEAVIAMQYDLKTAPLDIVPAGADLGARAFSALSNRDEVKPELRRNWLGPYLVMQTWDSNYMQYGTHEFFYGSDGTPESIGYLNFLWLRIQNVPEPVALSLNEIMDGADETNPRNSGKVQWRTTSGQNVTNIRLMDLLR